MLNDVVLDPIALPAVFEFTKNILRSLNSREAKHRVRRAVRFAARDPITRSNAHIRGYLCEVNLSNIIEIPPVPTDIVRRSGILRLVAYMLEQRIGHRIMYRAHGDKLVNEYLMSLDGGLFSIRGVYSDHANECIQLSMMVGQPGDRREDHLIEAMVHRYFQVACSGSQWATGEKMFAQLAGLFTEEASIYETLLDEASIPPSESPSNINVTQTVPYRPATVSTVELTPSPIHVATCSEQAMAMVDAIMAPIIENLRPDADVERARLDTVIQENGTIVVQFNTDCTISCTSSYASSDNMGRAFSGVDFRHYPVLVDQVSQELSAKLGVWCSVLSLPVRAAMNCVVCIDATK